MWSVATSFEHEINIRVPQKVENFVSSWATFTSEEEMFSLQLDKSVGF
jgi:hypothetical protein